MKTVLKPQNHLLVLAASLVLLIPGIARAYPPAPHHTIYGLVRDELGQPLAKTNAVVVFETSSGVQVTGALIPNLRPGVNYQIIVPMDSGLTSDAYKPTALRPFVPFRVRVRIGSLNYLPIEMTGNFSSLGNPGEKTRVDLTLGEDTDGDGIPDAWERMVIAVAGGGLTLADINPNGDLDGDGVSNYAEYIAGTYAFDPADGFILKIAGLNNGAALLDFLAIRGRSYTLFGSTDVKTWIPLSFRIPAEGPTGAVRHSYEAVNLLKVRVEVVRQPDQAEYGFFKLQVN
jgi:hypothetical protein